MLIELRIKMIFDGCSIDYVKYVVCIREKKQIKMYRWNETHKYKVPDRSVHIEARR